MGAPGQGCLEKGTATTSHSRQIGSAAEGPPELETGISRTPAVLPLSCASWCHVGHVRRVVLILGSDGAFQEHPGAVTGRGQAEKDANSASAWAEKIKISVKATVWSAWQV